MGRWAKPIIAALIVVIGATLIWWQMAVDRSYVYIDNTKYSLIGIEESEKDRRQGLSGMGDMPETSAMLFVFPQEGDWGFWMKDMDFAIDILWLDTQGTVVYMVRDVQPSSYPTTFKPDNKRARYVIELRSGTIERTGIREGSKAKMPLGI